MKKDRIIYWLIGVSVVLLITPILVYFWYFKGADISKLTSDWGAFSSFITPFIALCNLIIIAYITVYIHRNFLVIEKPMIIFKNNRDTACYIIKNIGKGAAMNIILKYKDNKKDEKWDRAVKCYSLAPNDEFEIFWKKGGDEWIALYEDIFKNSYFSDMQDDNLVYKDFSKENFQIEKRNTKETIWSVEKVI